MDNFIATVVFSLPGLLAYFWLRMFGVNPPTQHTVIEMMGISALLWVPTVGLFIIVYDIGYFLLDKTILLNLGLRHLWRLEDIKTMSTNLIFLFYFIILNIIFSFAIAWIWSVYGQKGVLKIVNKVRIKRNVSKLSENTSTWDSFFLAIDEKEKSSDGSRLVVEVYKLGESEKEKIVGCIKNASRPFEPERALILDDPSGWKEAHDYFRFPIKQTYIDLETGIVVNELKVPKECENQLIEKECV
ncbi:hypothetical protein JQC72_14880 [Polycladomyces sp. WAk]|uniref:Uncharacterized protein n=1 Tax=Polycladomyces zharkentensis TaxID=2807616 RepID=A0ABS2WMM3_9BACL|nr:hypothetical protein [Polycladomyces sp. WAk]MBN2910783.1 hypothetical protein [Polycladomyces sp. WAk]